MGDIADGLINGDFDFYTGEYLGEGDGFPRTTRRGKPVPVYSDKPDKDDKSWRRVIGFLSQQGIKQHLHPQVVIDYGCKYGNSKSPLKKACYEILTDFDKFKKFVIENKHKYEH